MALQLHTNEALPATAEVVVIGGGVIGASIAFNLTKRGVRDVVVLERKHLGAGASGKSGALVRAHYTNVPESRLTHESIKVFQHWGDVVGYGDPGFVQTGFVRVVAPADEAALWANVAAMREDVGVDTWVVSPEDLREIEPLMRTDDITVAAFEPNAGYCDPNATVYGFVEAAIAGGARVYTHTAVARVVTDSDRVVGVETEAGVIATRQVVIAAGALADRLLTPLGIDLGLKPRRSQVVLFRWPVEIDQSRKHRVVIDSTQHSWFRSEGDNCTLIGAEFADRSADPERFNESVDDGYVDHARRALAARFPAFEHATMRGSWTGVYMQSPDAHPFIDKVAAVDGLYVMAGDSGTSFKTSPAIGQCMAEWIVEGASRLMDLHPFRTGRLAEGQPWVDEFAYDAAGNEKTIAR